MHGYMTIYDRSGEKIAVHVMVDHGGVDMEACARAIYGAYGAKAGRLVLDMYDKTYTFLERVEICG